MLKMLCPLAPPSMVRWLGHMTLQHDALSVSLTYSGWIILMQLTRHKP